MNRQTAKKAEEIAKRLAKEAGQPESLWELFLTQAYEELGNTPKPITITLDPEHLAFVERGAEVSGITVEKWVNSLIGLSKKAIPQLCRMAGIKGANHADN